MNDVRSLASLAANANVRLRIRHETVGPAEEWFSDARFKIFCAKCWEVAKRVCLGP